MAIKSSGMVARTPWQAAATAAAGEVTEGSGLDVFVSRFFFCPATSRGGDRSGRHRWGCRRNEWWICFYDGYTCRSIFVIELFWGLLFAAKVKKPWMVDNICGHCGEPWIVQMYRLRFVLDGLRNLFRLVVLKCISCSNQSWKSERLVVFFLVWTAPDGAW